MWIWLALLGKVVTQQTALCTGRAEGFFELFPSYCVAIRPPQNSAWGS
jgi:hypothetical protein